MNPQHAAQPQHPGQSQPQHPGQSQPQHPGQPQYAAQAHHGQPLGQPQHGQPQHGQPGHDGRAPHVAPMGYGQPSVDLRIVSAVASSRTWVSWVGWGMIAMGVMYALTIVGLFFAWLPIWLGVSLLGAAGNAKRLSETGSVEELLGYVQRVRTYFTVMGVLLALTAVMFLVALAGFGSSIFAALIAASGNM